MKKQLKIKKILNNKSRKNSRTVKDSAIPNRKKQLSRKSFRLIESKNSGRLVDFHNTSYFLLVLIVLVLGLIMFCVAGFNDNPNVLGSHTVLVTAVVPEPNNPEGDYPTADGGGASPIVIKGIDMGSNDLDDSYQRYWFDRSVPFYLLLLAVTLGFWAGDLFDRHFRVSKYSQRINKQRSIIK